MAILRQDINAIISDNLSLLNAESRSVEERRLAQLRDRALFIARDDSFIDWDSRVEEFSSMFEYSTGENSNPEIETYISSRYNGQSFSDKLLVCQFLAEIYKERRVPLLERLLKATPGQGSVRIVYFQNAYADAAFRIFSGVLENPSAFYASDFTAVCEEVYYGRADMCMLPLDSSRDAKLISFYRLIEKYELSPVYSCDVTTPDGEITTRYALLKRSFGIPKREYLEREDSCFFEFTLVPDEGASLCDVLAAAKECGLSFYKVDSIPLTYSTSKFACDVILKVGNADALDAFVLFLSLAVPQYEPIGIYPHIRAKD
ncbi:MAG: hypothetical protein IKU61_05570 [Clostridia bacterium]|nr:hypothetical protein [Clostridia bacterium]